MRLHLQSLLIVTLFAGMAVPVQAAAKQTVCMIGEGAWGTAIATVLAHNGYTVKMWCYEPSVVDTVAQTGINSRFLPGIPLDTERIKPTTDLQEALADVDWVFEAIPVRFLRSILVRAKEYATSNQIWICLSKGIEQDSLMLPSQIINEVFDHSVATAVLAGPSFADDVAHKQLTGVTVASADHRIAIALQEVMSNDYFRAYASTDELGVQMCSALKNVITLGVGMLEGAGYADNTKTFFFMQGLNEMGQFAQKLGGAHKTVYDFAGLGDLVLTSMGKLSRNLEVGKRIGAGQSLETILQETGFIPEGVNTVVSIHQLLERINLKLPLCEGIYDIIFNGGTITRLLTELVTNP